MLQFTLYQHDWKEHFDPKVMNYYMKAMQGEIEITELEVTGDCFDYCIHTSGVDEKWVQRIADAWYSISYTTWFKDRFNKTTNILTLKDDFEMEKMFEMYLDMK